MTRDRVADILVLKGLVTPEQIAPIVDQFGEDFAGFRQEIIQKELVTEMQLADAIGLIHNLPVVDLMKFPSEAKVVALIPGQIAQKYQVLPITVVDNHITLARVDPGNVFAVDDVAKVTGM